ncbi:E1A-binding protein p400 [Drosophila innubila]|uniref:E1A-binding protein p400 n=1 Tax=Drosophila innubila TaxID=198719 RepID=UPI00148DF918|nr:E1A-binding protein p400 [Drosophila innubila]
MKNLLVPLNGTSDEPVPSNNNCNFHKDALLGFALDEQLDSAVMQLQAAAAEQQQQHSNNNNNNNSSNSGDYHQSLLQCVDLMPTAVAPTDLPECYQFDADAAAAASASELVNVANKDCDSLAKLAYNLYRLAKEDHIVIDRKRNEVVRTNAVTNQKTIYRCMDPVGMGMCSTDRSSSAQTCFKVTRSKKRTAPAPATTTTATATRTTTTKTESKAETIAAPNGAIKKQMNEPIPAADADSMHRTRSGRIVRAALPQAAAPMSLAKASAPNSTQMMDMLVAELRDKDYRAPVAAATPSAPPAVAMREPRAVPQNAICPGCNKIFLGRRLQRHYVKFPEHMPSAIAVCQEQQQQQQLQQEQPQPQQQQHQQQQQSNVPTLFGLLTAQLQRHGHLNEEQRADLFLHELNDFVEQLQLRSTRLIRNTSGLHFVNARIARVLGIPEGQYALDMSAMESAQAPTPEPELHQLMHANAVPGPRNLVDYPGLSMSLDDTLTDEAAQRLNLSAGGKLLPPSEESLLRNVSDLMQPPVAVAPPTVGHVAGAMLPHYDHASDNAVEALSMKETPNAAILDLNVDFFQFNNN